MHYQRRELNYAAVVSGTYTHLSRPTIWAVVQTNARQHTLQSMQRTISLETALPYWYFPCSLIYFDINSPQSTVRNTSSSRLLEALAIDATGKKGAQHKHQPSHWAWPNQFAEAARLLTTDAGCTVAYSRARPIFFSNCKSGRQCAEEHCKDRQRTVLYGEVQSWDYFSAAD